jgi:hypothetical protein
VRIAAFWAELRAWRRMRCRFFFSADLMLAIWKVSHSAKPPRRGSQAQ